MAEETGATLPRIAHEELVRFIAAAYRAAGIETAEAEKAAELMAASDVSGADGHGVFRLPQYIRRIKAGGLNTRPEIKVIRGARATALVDGDNGLGSLRRGARGRRSDRTGAPEWGRLGRHPQRQPRRRRRGLCGDAARARHDRALFRSRQRQPPAALGRDRYVVVNKSDRGRGAGVGRAAAGARHGDHGRRLRQGQGRGAARQNHARGLDDRPRGETVDRPEPSR